MNLIAVFPLPNVVFFPRTNLPLHIFEPRYCEMVRECSATGMHIGMFLLQPGWEQNYYGNPPCFPIGCAGEITQVQDLPDGKYNIVLRGLHRVQLIEEIQENPFRKAQVEILRDKVDLEGPSLDSLRTSLAEDLVRKVLPESTLPSISDFTEFVNSLATELQLDTDTKYRLLEQDDVLA